MRLYFYLRKHFPGNPIKNVDRGGASVRCFNDNNRTVERDERTILSTSRVLASLSTVAHRRISRNPYRIFPAIVWKCQ